MNKRQKIIIASAILTIGLLFTTQTSNIIFRRFYLIPSLGIVAYLLSLWALMPGLDRKKAIILFFLPVLFTCAVPSFYFLYRQIGWLTRLPTAIFFGFSFYSLLLVENVFHISTDKTIPLYRAASAASFVYTILTSILAISVIFALDLPFYLDGLLIFLLTIPLSVHLIWSVELGHLTIQILVYSFCISLLAGEYALALSFWPLNPIIAGILISTLTYLSAGTLVEQMRGRLTQSYIWEEVGVGGVVVLLGFLVTSWKA